MSAIELRPIVDPAPCTAADYYDPHMRYFHRPGGRKIVGVDVVGLTRNAIHNLESVQQITIPATVWQAPRTGATHPVLWEYGGGSDSADRASQCMIVGTVTGKPMMAHHVRRVFYPFSTPTPNCRHAMCSITQNTVFAIGFAHRNTECTLVYRIHNILPIPALSADKIPEGLQVSAANADLIGIRIRSWDGTRGWTDAKLEAAGVDIRGMIDGARRKMACPQYTPSYIGMTWTVGTFKNNPLTLPTLACETLTVAPDDFVAEIRKQATAYRFGVFERSQREDVAIYQPTSLVQHVRLNEDDSVTLGCRIYRRARGEVSDLLIETVLKDDALPVGMPAQVPFVRDGAKLLAVKDTLRRSDTRTLEVPMLTYW